MQELPVEMEYTTETVEVEEINEDGVPTKKFKKVVKATFDPKFITQFETNDPTETECIEIDTNDSKHTIQFVKTIPKPNTIASTASTNTTTVVTPVKNNRSMKRQIRVMDPNLPAFVCTEHNENISLDCRYCRIASGFKKKNLQKNVQNNEISSSGKVTVAIPKRDANNTSVKVQNKGLYDGMMVIPDKIHNQYPSQKQYQKFRPEWLLMPEFKDWLVEFKISEDAEFSQCKCKYCGTLLVNNANNLVRHAISIKHMKSMQVEFMESEGQIPPALKSEVKEVSKEEIFGRYVASELKRIKTKKTYEEVKWKILQALQTAAEKEADDPGTLST